MKALFLAVASILAASGPALAQTYYTLPTSPQGAVCGPQGCFPQATAAVQKAATATKAILINAGTPSEYVFGGCSAGACSTARVGAATSVTVTTTSVSGGVPTKGFLAKVAEAWANRPRLFKGGCGCR
jgi:hypothetical protein